jgi:hypothetical protein
VCALRAFAAAVLLTVALAGAVARASETVALNVGFSPYRLGRSTTLKIAMRISTTAANQGLPAPMTRFDIRIPSDLEFTGSGLGLDICQPAELIAGGFDGCPPNARLGLGVAEILVPVGPEPVREQASIEGEMGPPVGEDVGVLLYAQAKAPVAAQLIFPGVLLTGAGQSLDTSVPAIPSVPGAPDVSMVSVTLSLGPDRLTYYRSVHGRRAAYRPEGIALPARCPRGGFRFVSDVAFADGTMARAASVVRCPSRHR